MARLVSYLTFDGNCAEAMTFYKTCFGGELELNKVGEGPMAGKMPPEVKDQIMHSRLSSGKIELMASDMMGHGELAKGNNITLCLICESEQELKELFDKLSSGGKVTQPVAKEFFGWYGGFADKFGINWMLQADLPKQ